MLPLQALLCHHTTEPAGCQRLAHLPCPPWLRTCVAHPKPASGSALWICSAFSEQFKWIIGPVMRRKWIVHLLISDQSPLSCSWCSIRLALCAMTRDSVREWVPVGSGTSSPKEVLSSRDSWNIFHAPSPTPPTNETSRLHCKCSGCRC